jgi:integrase
VDLRLTSYAQARGFRKYTAETRRNHATDLRVFLTFLSGRNVSWWEASRTDIEDYEDWRRFAQHNPRRIGGAKWDRELSVLASLYAWATEHQHVQHSPIVMKRIVSRDGTAAMVPAARAKDARRSNVHWLTPRSWRRWIDIGLRGHTRDGMPEPGWVGRLEDRNVAYVRLMVTSGLRRGEGGSLLTVEVPARERDTGRYCRGRIAAEVTRSKKPRTFYVAADAVAEVETYCDSSRALAIRQAQKARRYERMPERRLVTAITGGLNPVVTWRDQDGVTGRRGLNAVTVTERMTLFIDGRHGPEPLWLWLNEQGLPFQVHSWDGVFTTANRRCVRILTPPERLRFDPHKVYAPYATPHSTRHSFALYMLVVLNTLMDHKYGLTPEERRDFRQLYGDPWFMVQNLLGHASRETTVERYLAPVADLQLRSMLADATDPVTAPMPELDAVFARIAKESVGIQDIDDFGPPAVGDGW